MSDYNDIQDALGDEEDLEDEEVLDDGEEDDLLESEEAEDGEGLEGEEDNADMEYGENVLAEFQAFLDCEDDEVPIPEKYASNRDLTEKCALSVRLQAFDVDASLVELDDRMKAQLRKAVIRKIKGEMSVQELIEGSRRQSDFRDVRAYLKAYYDPDKEEFLNDVYPSMRTSKAETISKILESYC